MQREISPHPFCSTGMQSLLKVEGGTGILKQIFWHVHDTMSMYQCCIHMTET